MTAGRGVAAVGPHDGEIGAGKADIAQQMVVVLHQVREDPLALLGGAESGGAPYEQGAMIA